MHPCSLDESSLSIGRVDQLLACNQFAFPVQVQSEIYHRISFIQKNGLCEKEFKRNCLTQKELQLSVQYSSNYCFVIEIYSYVCKLLQSPCKLSWEYQGFPRINILKIVHLCTKFLNVSIFWKVFDYKVVTVDLNNYIHVK